MRPPLYNSFRLVLTLHRATEKAPTISSALSALREYSRAWICARVRLMPQRVPNSLQCRRTFRWQPRGS
jgi:hypothetical protein